MDLCFLTFNSVLLRKTRKAKMFRKAFLGKHLSIFYDLNHVCVNASFTILIVEWLKEINSVG